MNTPASPLLQSLMQKFRNPEVPAELVTYTCGPVSFEEFLRSGAEVYTMLDLAAGKHANRGMRQFECVLDFGCGCGRILRYLAGDLAEVHACEINAQVSSFASASSPGAHVYQNSLMPPLRYEDKKFDLIYSFSVFSHLTQEVETEWLRELVRVGRPGCLYLLSVHGDWVIEATLGAEAGPARAAGFYLRNVNTRNGTDLDFPDYYEASYHTSDYIRHKWGSLLEIVDIIKGDDPSRYLWNDLRFEPTGTVPLVRPMGQDLVVARKH